MKCSPLLLAALLAFPSSQARAQDDKALAELTKKIQALKPSPYEPGSVQAKEAQAALAQLIKQRRVEANRKSTDAWKALKGKADWEKFRDAKIKALRESLMVWPEAPKELKVRVTKTLKGDGYQIENLLYESRPGLWVTANLYSPAKPAAAMPGIIIIHSHHNPKTQGELQDMGVNWARQGCLVLIPDQLGHGERRQHLFTDAGKYPGPFKVGRQDYYFRYNVGNQLHLIGDSQIGWMVWDLMRGVDLLFGKQGIDRDRIILLGSVAGGGDPCAVAAALDNRIRAAVPFNFGGPQPETTLPLPKDAEAKFNYLGGGSWESTRNLRLSGRDGFLPWVIVAATAPRPLVYAHEFAWDEGRDPVWQRFETIYGWYGAADKLSWTKGKGSVKGQAGPDNTHCNNIGPIHRRPIYESFKDWFKMTSPLPEVQDRRKAVELECWTDAARQELKPLTAVALADRLAGERLAAVRQQRTKLAAAEQRKQLRQSLAKLLGKVTVGIVPADLLPATNHGSFSEDPQILEGEPDRSKDRNEMPVPTLLLRPDVPEGKRVPVVVAVAQHGTAAFLKQRAETIAALLRQKVAVCLVDVRGTGATRPADGSRGRQSTGTSLSATEQMLGDTLLGARLRDLRAALVYLRRARDIDSKRIALWGDSFAPENAAGLNVRAPLDADKLPTQAEPLGGLLALLGALYEDDVKAVYVRGGLTGYRSLLKSQFAYLPHDALLPGVLTVGDLDDVAAALAPRAIRLEGLVSGLNQRATAGDLAQAYGLTRAAYQAARQGQRLTLRTEPAAPAEVADWFAKQLQAP